MKHSPASTCSLFLDPILTPSLPFIAQLCLDSGVDITADAISAVVTASGNKIPGYYATVFASYIEKAGGIEPFIKAPSGGGGGGGGGGSGGGDAPAAAAAPEKPKEEEVDALDGGMDMFGGNALAILFVFACFTEDLLPFISSKIFLVT